MGVYSVKVGDLEPPLVATLTDTTGPIDLTTVATVVMNAQQIDGTKVISGPCTVVGPGRVQYAWRSGDTDTIGLYRMDFTLTWAGNRPRTVPNAGYETLSILARA